MQKRSLLLSLSLLLVATSVEAQNCRFSPSDSPTVGCNVIPWGTKSTSTTWVNQRYQAQFSPAEMGNAKFTVASLAFAPCASNAGVHSSTSLVITMAHHKGALTTNFVTNLGANSKVVLNATNHKWKTVFHKWSNVGLTSTFNYDPALGNLLIDITVKGNNNTGSHTGGASNIRPRVFAFRWTGTPPTTGTLGSSAALTMRVCGTGGSFRKFGKGCPQPPCVFAPTDTPSVGGCNVIPWGTTSTSTTWANQRYQTTITKAELGVKRTITQLAFAQCTRSGTHSSKTLEIRMAHIAGALGTNFATNLGANSVLVLKAANHKWTTTANKWSNVGLTTPFSYDPAKGNLLIDILVTGNNNSAGTTGMHVDSPRRRLFAFRWTTTPPATGTIQTSALKMRVCGAGNATPLDIAGTGTPNVGLTVNVNLAQGRPSSPGFVLLGAQKNVPLTAIGMPGCTQYASPVLVFAVAVNAMGISNKVALAIPNNLSLVGQSVFSQGLNINPSANALGIAASGGLEIKVGK